MLSLGLFAKYLRTFGVPATCLVAQTSNTTRADEMVLETGINHMPTVSSFRRCGRKEHYGRSLCLSPMPENKTSAFSGAEVAQVTALGDVSFSRAALGQEHDLGARGGVCVYVCGGGSEAPLTGLKLPRPWL